MCSDQASVLPVVTVKELGKTYLLYQRPQDRLWQFFLRHHKRLYQEHIALAGVSFTLSPGEIVGIVGRNGSGKSTLLQMICGTLAPTKGEVNHRGRIAALLELGAGFNPEFTGRENVYLNAAIMGFSRQETDARLESILQFANIGPFIDQPIKLYSSGMVVRLAFAVAVASEPEILVVDEALAVGDEAFQSKCFDRIRALRKTGTAILFVSHSAQTVLEICDRALLIEKGALLLDDAPKKVIAQYQRLVHAPDDKRAEIARAIREGDSAAQSLSPESDDSVSHATVAYASEGAHIQSPRLLSADGEVAAVLETGQSYIFQYHVFFAQQYDDVGFGMLIKTRGGVELGGYILRAKGGEGSHVTVSFKFVCRLLPGHYFLNAGISMHGAEGHHFLHRLVDAVGFSVVSAERSNLVGLVDFSIEAAQKKKFPGTA